MDRIHPSTAVTFRDLLPAMAGVKEVKEMTPEEFAELPQAGPFGIQGNGWLRTGYLLAQRLLLQHEFIYWTFVEYVSHRAVDGDFGAEIRYETKTYLVHIEGEPVIERRAQYA